MGDYAVSQDLAERLIRVSSSQRMGMSVFARLTNQISQRMENYAAAEGLRLRRRFPRKLALIGIVVGIVVVILLALWMEHRP